MTTSQTEISVAEDTQAGVLARALSWPGRLCLYAGGVALVIMMGLTVADVILRNLFSIVVPGGIEMTGLLMIIVALSTLAVVEIERNHIRVDLLLRLLYEPVRVAVAAGGLMLTLAMMIVTAVRIVDQAGYLRTNDIVTGVLRVHEWPFVMAGAVFVILFALALAINLVQDLGTVARQRNPVAYLVLLVSVGVVAAIFYLSFHPEALPFEMPRVWRGGLSILLCFVLIFLSVHVAAAMAVTSLLGISLLINAKASLTSLGTTTIDVVSDPTWSVVPLFTWMGLIVVASGFAESLFRAAYRWIGHLPGGLASASTIACAGLSSIVGDTLSGVYSMGSIALPQMRKYDYDMKLATASIACAATIGVMVPPSIAFIVYGMITEVSIGKLFMAG
ncbi:MAG: TRAP transporter large permease subunit, partial [Nitratireductor sp.]|nr:TRAP transporter large permease subunit [Nitratireductor sp.]